ncbi:MAG TPA: radical SAM protein [Phycisphaerae bacterium]|nr:radical SAM protein [Phycisphaerae bacterium]HRY69712.1 radical SAM protein [Phycisphaerae bacterium]HSA25091.1 radical SAM protein [Phycisphaerae bacterium]
MKIIAAITADFERTFLGRRSRLNDELLGETVLRRTVKRVLAAKRLASVHLLVDKSQEEQARQTVAGLAVRVETHQAGGVPWESYVASARKWSLDAWRGGLAGTCVFDESVHPWLLEALARREQAEGVVDVPAAAVLLDPVLLDAMVEHYEKVYADVRMTFTQAAPGLSAAIYAPALLADLMKANQPPGRMMAYQPALPQRDLIMLPCFYPPEVEVRRACGRCVADTDAAMERITAILARAGGSADDPFTPDVLTVSRFLLERWGVRADPLPGEVEIELTTEDPLATTTIRPRGEILGRRGPMADSVFDRLIEELARRDDVRVVLGGFGDSLHHPSWQRCVRKCREAGVFGLAVRTTAARLDDAAIQTLVEARVDVLNVLIDAATREKYLGVHNVDLYEQVVANVERLLAVQTERQQPQPIVVCELTKTTTTMEEMESFYDRWVSRVGTAVISGPSSYAGQWPDLSVMDMAPPKRVACERLFSRAMVLADGRVPVCDQDFKGLRTVGSVTESSFAALWSGQWMVEIREGHAAGRFDAMSLCPGCREWHRP